MRVVQVKISFASPFVIAVVFSPRRWQISPKEKLFFLYVHRQRVKTMMLTMTCKKPPFV